MLILGYGRGTGDEHRGLTPSLALPHTRGGDFSPVLVAANAVAALTPTRTIPRKDMLVPKNFTVKQAEVFEKVFATRVPDKCAMFVNSAHYEAGLSCVTCHVDAKVDADAGTAEVASFQVGIEVCAECHKKEHAGFARSRHVEALTVFTHVVRYKALGGYPEMQQKGCNMCHEKIGNSCTSCHPGHSFKKPKPPVDEYGGCAECHLGIDHHQLEAYQSSVHYQVARASGTGTPNCVFCHTEDENRHEIFRIKGTADHGRSKMMAKCQKCHAKEFAEQEFAKIDRVKEETDKVLEEARQIVGDLYSDGILKRVDGSLLDENGRPILNANVTAYDQHIHPIENLLFRMFKYDAVAAVAGAQHFSPVRTHWFGHAQLMESYNRVREAARHLRFEHALATNLGIEIKERIPYRYTFETGKEFEDVWKDPAAFRERLKQFYTEANKQ
jgi:hypothetical protein